MAKHAKKKAALEPISDLTFGPAPYNLDSIPSNEEAGKQAADGMPVFRMAAVVCGYDDKELEQIVRQDLKLNVDLLERIVSELKIKKHQFQTLEQAFGRLQIICERVEEKSRAAS